MPINDRRVIGHVGSIGPKHFLYTLAEMIETLPEDKFYLIIGGNSPEVEEVLSPLSQKKRLSSWHLSHEELGKYYQLIDIGLVLYRGLDLNFEYCNSNKLYEYWSYGIKVMAHQLQGLTPIFQSDWHGRL